jgi:hypothetical protein
MRLRLLFSLLVCPAAIFAQVNNNKDTSLIACSQISAATMDKLNNSYAGLNTSVNRQSTALVQQLQKKENALKSRLQKLDSSGAQQLFAASGSTYQTLLAKLSNPVSNPVNSIQNYVPGIDSIKTAIGFLSNAGLSADKLQSLQSLGQRVQQLQGSLQNAGEVQNFVTQRLTQLQNQLTQNQFTRQLASMKQSVFYYQQQLAQYKNILNDRQQQQQLILTVVSRIPAFQRFWQSNSMLAQLYPIPGNAGTLLSGQGLQTSDAVGKLVQQRLGTSVEDGGKNASQYLQQQVGDAQGQMDQLKGTLDRLNLNGGSSNMTLPNSTPNSQHQKSFFKRLDVGFNFQTTAATPLLPAISTIGVNLTYLLSDKTDVGVGVNYLLGLGNAWNEIRFSNQGAGLKAFADVKGWKSIWITGEWDYNYMEEFTSIKIIKDLDLWQASALIGLTKRFNAGKHSGNIQLLYNILADQQIPHVQALTVRFGFGF